MDEEQEGAEQRKPYSKPEIYSFPLRPEEAVLGACKMGTSAGPGAIGCESLGAACTDLVS